MQKFRKYISQGFTLIELLVVLGVLSVLAAVLLVLVDPVEQLARADDTGRKSSITQLGRSLQGYYTQNGAAWPAANTWRTSLTNSELRLFPSNPSGITFATADCTGIVTNPGNLENNFCYRTDTTDAVVYTKMESKTEINKANAGAACATITWYVWSSAEGKSGLLCSANPPSIGVTGLY